MPGELRPRRRHLVVCLPAGHVTPRRKRRHRPNFRPGRFPPAAARRRAAAPWRPAGGPRPRHARPGPPHVAGSPPPHGAVTLGARAAGYVAPRAAGLANRSPRAGPPPVPGQGLCPGPFSLRPHRSLRGAHAAPSVERPEAPREGVPQGSTCLDARASRGPPRVQGLPGNPHTGAHTTVPACSRDWCHFAAVALPFFSVYRKVPEQPYFKVRESLGR